MNVYDVFIPELEVFVKFKVLDPSDTETFLQSVGEVDSMVFKTLVLENYVFNLRTEIIERLDDIDSVEKSEEILDALYHACVQLNPSLDVDTWIGLAFSGAVKQATTDLEPTPPPMPPGLQSLYDEDDDDDLPESSDYDYKKIKPFKITKTKYANLGKELRDGVVGQEEAIRALESVLKRSHAGLNDPHRPLGVFLFAGSSGTGKTLLAKTLNSYLYGNDKDIIRVDCGELQHKHENQKILGAPPGYLGHDAGGALTNALMENPNTVVLLDEVEKAHPDVFNTFLRIFDEGLITDSKGNVVSFRNAIIIMTTNLGNKKIVNDLASAGVGFSGRIGMAHEVRTAPKRDVVERETRDAVKKHFSPELLNRVDGVIVFNHLTEENFKAIAELELAKVDAKLTKKGIRFSYDESALEGIVELGVDSVKGARGISGVRRERIEDLLADVIISTKIPRGTLLQMTYVDGNFNIEVSKPIKKAESEK